MGFVESTARDLGNDRGYRVASHHDRYDGSIQIGSRKNRTLEGHEDAAPTAVMGRRARSWRNLVGGFELVEAVF